MLFKGEPVMKVLMSLTLLVSVMSFAQAEESATKMSATQCSHARSAKPTIGSSSKEESSKSCRRNCISIRYKI